MPKMADCVTLHFVYVFAYFQEFYTGNSQDKISLKDACSNIQNVPVECMSHCLTEGPEV